MNSNNRWEINIDKAITFNVSNHLPVIGDWDNDGIDTVGVRKKDD